MTIAVDPEANVSSGQPPDDRPTQEPPPADSPFMSDDVLNAAVAFALSDISVDTGRVLLKTMHQNRRRRVEAQLVSEVVRASTAEQRAASAFERARADHIVAVERLRAKSELEEQARILGDAIRYKRHELEAKRLADELVRLDVERHDSMEHLGRDRTRRHDAEVTGWNDRADERRAQVDHVTSLRTQLSKEEGDARAMAAERMNRWMTRTASGFLVWAGYTVIGATGLAVAALLNDSQGRNLLTDVGASAVKLMDDLGRGSVHPMLVAPLSLLAFLATLVGLVLGMDVLMRWFDKRWMEKRQPSPNSRFTFPTKHDLSRSTFSKLLIAVPFIYISGVIVAFIAYGGRVASNTMLIGKNSGVLNALIGSALCLLSASIFLLYFVNILEPRTFSVSSRWRNRWEIGAVPFVMLLAIVLIAIFGPHSRWAWAGVTAFMLLGAMALGYGLLYRGMFRDIDFAARAVDECDRRLGELLKPPQKEDPDRAEQREIDQVLSDYRKRRQQLLDFDRERRLRRAFLTSDANDTDLIAAYQVASSFLWRVWIRFRRLGPQPDFYRATDFEAAPVETADRQHCEHQIRQIDVELKVLDPVAVQARRDVCERELEKARQEQERAEREQPLTLATADERESMEAFDFEGAYALGASTKPAYKTIARRRDETISKSERPRVRRPVRTHAEEVQSGH